MRKVFCIDIFYRELDNYDKNGNQELEIFTSDLFGYLNMCNHCLR